MLALRLLAIGWFGMGLCILLAVLNIVPEPEFFWGVIAFAPVFLLGCLTLRRDAAGAPLLSRRLSVWSRGAIYGAGGSLLAALLVITIVSSEVIAFREWNDLVFLAIGLFSSLVVFVLSLSVALGIFAWHTSHPWVQTCLWLASIGLPMAIAASFQFPPEQRLTLVTLCSFMITPCFVLLSTLSWPRSPSLISHDPPSF
jgi:hypothetical protein